MCVCVCFRSPFFSKPCNCKFFQMVMWNISHGCVKHYICCAGLRGHRCNTHVAHACEEVSRGLALLPAGEDAHAALCLVWADSHLESGWNRWAHTLRYSARWLDILTGWKGGKKRKGKLALPGFAAVLWSLTSVGSPTQHKHKLIAVCIICSPNSSTDFLLSVYKSWYTIRKREINAVRLRGRTGQTRSKNTANV